MAFDVDGVLVNIKSSWEYLHEAFGTYDKSRKYLEMFKEGKISYYDWMYLDTFEWIARFNGNLHKNLIETELFKVPLNEEFKVLFDYSRELGVKTALISGGINMLVERAARFFGADYWFANVLLFDEAGYLIPGGIPLVPAHKKGEVLVKLARELNIERVNIAYIGDSAWDESAFREAGLSIIYGEEKEYPACAHAKTVQDVINAVESYVSGSLICGTQ